jgi:F-type H+-transporting ATPase subunit a
MGVEGTPSITLLGLPVSMTVVSTWIMVVVLALLAFVASTKIRQTPSRWQATLEWGLDALHHMLEEVTGGSGERYLPLVATVAIFVLVANLMSALPLVEAPTADINTPFALAVIVFFSVHYYGIRSMGVGAYLGKFAQPVVVLLPINILEHFTRTLSLTIRLFGNMMSHQIIVAIIFLILPLMVPVVPAGLHFYPADDRLHRRRGTSRRRDVIGIRGMVLYRGGGDLRTGDQFRCYLSGVRTGACSVTSR